MAWVVELTDPQDHPLRQKATLCAECGTKAVFFNDGNVDVSCHACGSREDHFELRRYHLMVYLEAIGELRKEGEDESL
jgi:hypothetical protein